MNLYQSEPMKIGKHLWRISVRYFDYLKCNCTVYEYQRISPYGDTYWKKYDEWPSYDGNKTYSGLPLTLSKLYYLNKPKFDHLLTEGK